ncbi:hypothetical protein J2X31_003494 [Flavobacterium arsenatis]|uniref:Outer membrane protein beta-barrel domain-containing protein n=1 Tax=Flavobacterium arsenatis TaxID=1484332 RepID=A0ABU1TUA1_9FLAO|nr:hypothetical protein [Flavobacterium arsenatis]MDR6969463.1 hypothetical protein [Flavobacterium arsenatis]
MKKLLFSFLLFPFLLQAQENEETQEIPKDAMHNKGFFNLTKISYTKITSMEEDLSVAGVGDITNDLETDGTNAFALQTINGYFLSPYISLGVGVGLEGFISPTINTFPAYADVRVYLENDYSSPFIFADYGTLMKIGDEFRRGNMFAVGAGYKFFVGKEKRTSLVTDLSFSGRNISMTDASFKDSDRTFTTRGISLGIGVIF